MPTSTSIEDNTQSFVVYTWYEDDHPVDDTAVRTWRGHITHITSGHKFHFGHLRQVADFLEMFVTMVHTEEDLVEFKERWRLFIRNQARPT